MHTRRKITASLNKYLAFDIATKAFSKKFENHLFDFEHQLKLLFLDTLNHNVGLSKWALHFTEILDGGYKVEIYCENEKEFNLIYKTIIHRMADVKFIFLRRSLTY